MVQHSKCGEWLHIYEQFFVRPGSKGVCYHCAYPEDHAIHIDWRARGITEEEIREYLTMPQDESKGEKKVTFDTGSKRNQLNDVRYDLISPIGLRRIAETYALGAAKYTDRNWEKGQPFSVLLNHTLDHINSYLAEQRGVPIGEGKEEGEDHIAHAAWNLFALMHFQEVMPAMNDIGFAQAAIKERMLKELPDPALHAFSGDVDQRICEACRKDREDKIHYQPTERSTEGG